MKFSIVSTILLAQGIAAMPWSTLKTSQSGEEITLRIEVSGASSGSSSAPKPHGSAIDLKNYEVCLKVCFPEEPKCPEGWNNKKFGDGDYPCWTCCKKTGGDDDDL
ncbi:pathogenicity protein [Fusarium heterosporum]|uniref:Pathogenicity protein n=1 Tax=Fusarium heterosporum TaxID=42747 RepID=A0A8H5WXW5_FUSHE|nr:pathogenicity protein [Fusarium heterosporum]